MSRIRLLAVMLFGYSIALLFGSSQVQANPQFKPNFELKTDYSKIFAEKKLAEEARSKAPKEPWKSEIKEYLAKDTGNKLLSVAGIRGLTKKVFYIAPKVVLKTAAVSSLISLAVPFNFTAEKSNTAAARISEYSFHQEVGDAYKNPSGGMVDMKTFYKKNTTHVGTRKFKEPDVLDSSMLYGKTYTPTIIEHDATEGILAKFTSKDGSESFFILVVPDTGSTFKTYELHPDNLSPESIANASKKFLGTYKIDLEKRTRVFEASPISSSWGFVNNAFYASILGLLFVKLDEVMSDK